MTDKDKILKMKTFDEYSEEADNLIFDDSDDEIQNHILELLSYEHDETFIKNIIVELKKNMPI